MGTMDANLPAGWRYDPSASNTTEMSGTGVYTIEPEEVQFDESLLDTLKGLPKTFADLPYPEDDDL